MTTTEKIKAAKLELCALLLEQRYNLHSDTDIDILFILVNEIPADELIKHKAGE